MIRLTGTNGTEIYINPDKIISFNEDDGDTFIDYGYDRYIVKEPAIEVARKVLEWRLAMERYKVSYGIDIITPNETPESYKDECYLRRLAGLEDKNG